MQVESGRCYANGNQVTPNSLTSVSAYIQQDDLFVGTLTVREHLTFQACLRMDPDIPYTQRIQRVQEVAKEVSTKCNHLVYFLLILVKDYSSLYSQDYLPLTHLISF